MNEVKTASRPPFHTMTLSVCSFLFPTSLSAFLASSADGLASQQRTEYSQKKSASMSAAKCEDAKKK